METWPFLRLLPHMNSSAMHYKLGISRVQISGVTGGVGRGRVPPETSDREIFAYVSGKKREGKKGKGVKIENKRRKL